MQQALEKVARALIFDKQGEVLLVQRVKPPDAGKWSLPGGKVDSSETSEEAVIREVKEELNLDFLSQDSFFLTDTQSVAGTICEVTFWKGEVTGEMKVKNDEISAIRYFSPQDLTRFPIAFNHKEILQSILK
jgi:8-oxo-dGTP diphosphatase